MIRLRSVQFILVLALVSAVLVFASRSAGASRTTSAPAVSGNATASTTTTCMSCHQTRGAVSQIQQLTREGRNMRPAWSPDGQKVAFYSNRTGSDDIWVAILATGQEVQLTTDPASDRRPNWSPDGTRIAFDSDRSGNRDIWVLGADGSGLRQVTSGPREELFASWSPDGQQITFFSYGSGTNELWIIDADGGNPRAIVPELATEQARQCSFACHEASWNQSGEQLVFHSERAGNRDIWLVNVDGTGLTRVTNDPDQDYFPSWTPDGRIVFMTERVGAERVWNDVRVINVDGSQGTTLFTEVAHGGPFYWSPEGNRIALHSQLTGDDFNIFVATIGEAPGEQAQPAAPVEAAPPQQQPAEAAPPQEQAAEAAPPQEQAADVPVAETTPPTAEVRWPLWFGAGAAFVGVVVIVTLGAIGLYLRRTGRK